MLWQQHNDNPTLHVHDRPQWPYQRPQRVYATPAPTQMPCKLQFMGLFLILNKSGNKTMKLTHNVSMMGKNGQSNTHTSSARPHTLPLTWKHIFVASTSVPAPSIILLCCQTNPTTSEAQQVPKHVGGFSPPACILLFEACQQQCSTWNK